MVRCRLAFRLYGLRLCRLGEYHAELARHADAACTVHSGMGAALSLGNRVVPRVARFYRARKEEHDVRKFHSIAALCGDGLRPELQALFDRLAVDPYTELFVRPMA